MKYAKMEKKEHKKGKDKETKKDMMMEMKGMKSKKRC